MSITDSKVAQEFIRRLFSIGLGDADPQTYIGFKKGVGTRRGTAHKRAVVALVDRDTGKSKWFHVANSTAADIHPIVLDNISREARLMTDEAKMYRKIGRDFADHGTTIHATGNYVDLNDRTIHTNTVEGAFSIFKRGMRGVYQHCAEHHLHRYLVFPISTYGTD